MIYYICDFLFYSLKIRSFLETEMYQENDEEFIRKISQTRDYILVTRKKKEEHILPVQFGASAGTQQKAALETREELMFGN